MKYIQFLVLFIMLGLIVEAQSNKGIHQQADLARIYKAMDKGRSGKGLKIGVIGGSITQGYAASTESKSWSNLMADWWSVKFPASKVELINAGWGGTGSDIGVHRVFDDLLKQLPDFIVVEFAVNDVEGELATKMMEGLIQQSLTAENAPGIMILMLKQDDGTTAQASHKVVGNHYGIPMVSFADLIDAQVAADGVALSSIFVDGLHPNDVGMAYIADFVKARLDSIFQTLPAAENLPEINLQLPLPIVGDTYLNTYQFFSDNIIPLFNQGWLNDKAGWTGSTPGAQIDFQVTGSAFSLVFTQNNNTNRGRAEVWVDDGEKHIIDAFMDEDWGTRYAFKLVQEGLVENTHVIHVKVIAETSTNGNNVHIARVLAAGNVGSAPPIAVTSVYEKTVKGRQVILKGSDSFDPDEKEITAYNWDIISKPTGSLAAIIDADKSMATFTPDFAGEYEVSLTVTAGINQSIPAMKRVHVKAENAIPFAVPGNDTLSAPEKYFRFDGTQSYDADGDALTYKWKLESAPEGSKTELLKDDSSKPQCTFDMEGEYLFSLVVSDSIDFSDKSFIKVVAKEGYTKVNEKPIIEGLLLYPNPTDSELTIHYVLTRKQPVFIEIFSINGNQIAGLTLSDSKVGVNTYALQMHDFTSVRGVYLIKLSMGNDIQTKKFTLI